MKKIIISSIILCFTLGIVAQDTTPEENKDGWKKGAVFSLNFSQIALSNWSAGGENTVTGIGLFDAFANYTEGNMAWDNTLSLGYGVFKQEGDDWFKNEDKLEFSSKYGLKAGGDWYYSGLVDFKSQFAKGYSSSDDTVHTSNFLAPGYLSLALGMDYKPNDNLSVLIAPISGKFTFVTDEYLSNEGSYGVDEGEKFRAEFGAYVKVSYKVTLMENIAYQTTLDLFSNCLNNPQNIDINWDNLLNFTINEYFNASLIFTMIYDDDIEFDRDDDGDGVVDREIAQLQIKEMFALGFSYKF